MVGLAVGLRLSDKETGSARTVRTATLLSVRNATVATSLVKEAFRNLLHFKYRVV